MNFQLQCTNTSPPCVVRWKRSRVVCVSVSVSVSACVCVPANSPEKDTDRQTESGYCVVWRFKEKENREQSEGRMRASLLWKCVYYLLFFTVGVDEFNRSSMPRTPSFFVHLFGSTIGKTDLPHLALYLFTPH